MPNDTYTQAALAADERFRRRVRGAFSTVAWQVLNEDLNTLNHANRVDYAQQVIRQLDLELTVILPSFVFRPNVMNFDTTHVYDFPMQTGQVVTAAGDPDLLSQLATDWDALAAAAGFPPLVGAA
jgi:hypothetical protein